MLAKGMNTSKTLENTSQKELAGLGVWIWREGVKDADEILNQENLGK